MIAQSSQVIDPDQGSLEDLQNQVTPITGSLCLQDQTRDNSYLSLKFQNLDADFTDPNSESSEDEVIFEKNEQSQPCFLPYMNQPDPTQSYQFNENLNSRYKNLLEDGLKRFKLSVSPSRDFIKFVQKLDLQIKPFQRFGGISPSQYKSLLRPHFRDEEWNLISKAPPNKIIAAYAENFYDISQRRRDYHERFMSPKYLFSLPVFKQLSEKMGSNPIWSVYENLYHSSTSIREIFYRRFQSYFLDNGLFNSQFRQWAIAPEMPQHNYTDYQKAKALAGEMIKFLVIHYEKKASFFNHTMKNSSGSPNDKSLKKVEPSQNNPPVYALRQCQSTLRNISRVDKGNTTRNNKPISSLKVADTCENSNMKRISPMTREEWTNGRMKKRSIDSWTPVPGVPKRTFQSFVCPEFFLTGSYFDVLTSSEKKFRVINNLCYYCGNHKKELTKNHSHHPFYKEFFNSRITRQRKMKS